MFRRKINTEIKTVFDKYKLPNIEIASTRDIEENLDSTIRFILKAEFTTQDLVKGYEYNPSYYIYDQYLDIRYSSFANLDVTLEALESFNWFTENRVTEETSQIVIDEYVERNLPKERKPLMSKSTRNVIWAVLGTIALNLLINIGNF